MKFPFIGSKKSSKTPGLQTQIEDLGNQVEELLQENHELHFEKANTTGTGSVGIAGQFGVVDEQFDKTELQKLFSSETWFYIAVNTIAKTISSLPFKIEKKKIIKQTVVQANGDKEEVYKETWMDAGAEPEANIFKFPNEMQAQMEFWYMIAVDLLATGEAFIHPHKDESEENQTQQGRLEEAIRRVRKTEVDCLYRINSAITQAVPSDEEDKIIDGYIMVGDGEIIGFDPDEIVHIKLPNPQNIFSGLSPIVPVMKKVLLDRYTDEHHLRFYKQGARLGGAIETTKKLTKEQMLRLTKTFESNFTGKRQHHKTLILPEGMKYNIIEQSPVDSALIEFSKTNKEPVLSAFNLPPIKVSLLDGATYSNAMIQNKTYYVDTIFPLTTLIEQAINKSDSILKPTRNLRFRFDFSQIEALQEDFLAKATSAKAMADSGMTINEVRQLVWELPPLEGGDTTPALQVPSAGGIPGLFNLSANEGESKDTANAQNDTHANSDVINTELTFEARVAQLIFQATSEGLHIGVATERAVTQALTEGLLPTPLVPETEEEDKNYEVPFSKEALLEYAKNVNGDSVAPFVEERRKEYAAFMGRLEKFITKNIKRKAYKKGKSFIIKNDLPNLEDLKIFINEESVKAAESLIKANKHGYKSNIPTRSINFPNEEALKLLKKISTRNIKSVSKTALKQLKNIITSSVSDNVSVGELSSRIQDAFKDITASKANTIARTETLAAVSLGQDLKSKDFKRMFDSEAGNLKRVWITAQDGKERDSHAKNNNVVVDSGDDFANGLAYPRDPKGSAGEVINCRCSFVDFLPEDEESILSTFSGGSDLAE